MSIGRNCNMNEWRQGPLYVTPPDAYDELGRGVVPPHWQPVLNYFSSDDAASGSPETVRSQMAVRDLDLERPWPLDPIPYVLSANDWRELESGLCQRAKLLDLVLNDLYQDRQLLSAGGLPPALLFGNPRYLLPLCDPQANRQNFLSLIAFDVARDVQGNWQVLADWTECPIGLGLCLENRLLTTQAMPELFSQCEAQRLRDFLQAYAADDQTGNTVILSPGPTDPHYFEHTYLGQYFGFQVVEGADLTVRGNALQLKTLEGLKPVSRVWRYTKSDLCDPLYLEPSSSDGVPGLVNVTRSGFAQVSNALGAGVIENDAFMSFLPGLSDRFLSEALLIPSVDTWWCGQPGPAQEAQNRHESLSFTDAFHRPKMMATNNAAFVARSPIPDDLDYRVVARTPQSLSHAPYLDEAENLNGGATTLRLFAAYFQGEYHLMPGGIARVSTPGGEVAKDVWVPESATKPLPQSAPVDLGFRRSDRDLPSRTADDLFWLGRYLERADGVTRALRCLFTRLGEERSDDLVSTNVVALLKEMDLTGSSSKDIRTSLQETNTGYEQLLQRIFHLANQVRERLSPDAWRIFLGLRQNRTNITHGANTVQYLDRQLERISALNGQIEENMTRGYGWRLLTLGRRMERCQWAIQVTTPLISQPSDPAHLSLLLELCDSTITYRARYQAIPRLDHVLHLLLLDDSNPRSITYQIEQLKALMAEMPLDQASDQRSESQRILLSALHELMLADPEKLADVVSKAGNRTQLRRVLNRLETTMTSLSQQITDTYFSHTAGSGRSR